MEVIIVGAGWYGCHIALQLAQRGHRVTLIEKEHNILSRCSGTFGIRLHRGPHYPRSPTTRRECHNSFERFLQEYPELVCWHEESIYAYGLHDAEGKPSKVSLDTFEETCFETPRARRLSPSESSRFSDIAAAFELAEPSIVVGEKLRRYMRERIVRVRVHLIIQATVQHIEDTGPETMVVWKTQPDDETFKKSAAFVINATGYQGFCNDQSLLSILAITVVYQVCIAFQYTDNTPSKKPISFIVMDGWYPCLMPQIDHDEPHLNDRYILTHGCYTILGSYKTPHEARTSLETLHHSPKIPVLKNAAEAEMCRFWPAFQHRFHYTGWKGEVLAKPCADSDFRSSLTFAQGRIVHIVPGKISNVFNACDELLQLLELDVEHQEGIVSLDGVIRVVKTSPLITSKSELQGCHELGKRTTYKLQTLRDME